MNAQQADQYFVNRHNCIQYLINKHPDIVKQLTGDFIVDVPPDRMYIHDELAKHPEKHNCILRFAYYKSKKSEYYLTNRLFFIWTLKTKKVRAIDVTTDQEYFRISKFPLASLGHTRGYGIVKCRAYKPDFFDMRNPIYGVKCESSIDRKYITGHRVLYSADTKLWSGNCIHAKNLQCCVKHIDELASLSTNWELVKMKDMIKHFREYIDVTFVPKLESILDCYDMKNY